MCAGRLLYLRADWPNARVEIPVRHYATERNGFMPWWDGVERYGRPEERWLLVRRVSNVYPYPPGQMMMSFFMPTWDVWWVPCWPAAVVAAVVPSVGMLRWGKRRLRARRGLCRDCGYDLRESGERCPECGAVVVGGRRAEAVAVAHGGGGV